MALSLTLKPGEYLIVNGCVIRNTTRRQTLHVENRADIIRGKDLMTEAAADTPTKRVCFNMQKALVQPELREYLDRRIQSELAQLVTTFSPRIQPHIFEAANFVSSGDYYRAFVALKPVLQHEDAVFQRLEEAQAQQLETARAQAEQSA